MPKLHPTAQTLALALPAAAAAAWAGVPAGAMIGATLAVAVAALAGAATDLPDPLRNAAFAGIGLSLGAGIDSGFLADLARWPVSLAVLALVVVTIIAVSGRVLTRVFGLDATTATLSTAPGALSYVVALSAEGRGDLRSVVTLQCLRLGLVTLTLPPALAAASGGAAPGVGWGAEAAAAGQTMGLPESLALLGVAIALAAGLARLRLPAAYLLAGLLASGVAHAGGLVSGAVPGAMVFASFAVTGAAIGCRFGGIARADVARLAAAAVTITAVATAISALGAAATTALTGLPFGQVWVAYAPGSVEAMSAVGLALGHEAAYVATHHIVRIMIVVLALPLALRLVAWRGGAATRPPRGPDPR